MPGEHSLHVFVGRAKGAGSQYDCPVSVKNSSDRGRSGFAAATGGIAEGIGALSMAAVFIDGTKIEANANKYSFVWRKSTEKKVGKVQAKIRETLPGMLEKLGIRFNVPAEMEIGQLKKLREKLYAKMEKIGVVMVHGKGQRKTQLQKVLEQVEAWLDKLKQYTNALDICGDRNSYSKTDHDATFMHMKEDHMQNGQLKLGYNMNTAICNELIIGHYVSSDRNDVHTFIPFMEQLQSTYKGHEIGKVVVDSGYESEENYCRFEQKDHPELVVKPSNHEQKKKKKYRTDMAQSPLRFQAIPSSARGHGEKDYFSQRQAPAHQPFHPGRRHFCLHQGRPEFPPIPPSWQGKGQGRMASFLPGDEHSQASSQNTK